ncbi:hypothetical protein D3C84_1069710 [compost metagenome]
MVLVIVILCVIIVEVTDCVCTDEGNELVKVKYCSFARLLRYRSLLLIVSDMEVIFSFDSSHCVPEQFESRNH